MVFDVGLDLGRAYFDGRWVLEQTWQVTESATECKGLTNSEALACCHQRSADSEQNLAASITKITSTNKTEPIRLDSAS